MDTHNKLIYETTFNLSTIPYTHQLYIVNGQYGIGKTSIIRSLLSEFIITEWSDEVQLPQKDIIACIANYSKTNNIQAMFEKKNEVLILENLSILATESSLRNFIEEINKLRKLFPLKPIIAITHNSLESLKIPDWVAYVYFSPPNFKLIHDYIDELLEGQIKLDVKAKNELWKRADKSFRKLRELTIVLPALINKKNVKLDDIQTILDLSISKDLGQDIYKSTQIMMRNYTYNPNNICKSITDQSMLAMMLHENSIDDIILKTGSADDKIHIYRRILNLYRYTDHLDNYIFNKQHWELHNICFKVKATKVSYLLNSVPTIKHKQEIVFTSLLSKSSIQFTNFRYIVGLKIRLKIARQNFIVTCLDILKNPGSYKHILDKPDIEKIIKLVTSAEFNPNTVDKKLLKLTMMSDEDLAILAAKPTRTTKKRAEAGSAKAEAGSAKAEAGSAKAVKAVKARKAPAKAPAEPRKTKKSSKADVETDA